MAEHTQVAVLGGGPGGYAAAFRAADLGLEVTLVDLEEKPGGVCLYRGCIPSKALLHVSKLIQEAEEAAAIGVSFGAPDINLDRVREWKEEVVQQMVGGLAQLSRRRNVRYIQGRGEFQNSQSLLINTADGEQVLEYDHAILATGSRPATIPPLEVDSERVLNSRTALNLPDTPKKLLVIGGGYIGLELGQVYSSLGTEVSVVEMMPSLLPGVDKDLVKPLSQRIEDTFEDVILKSKVVEMKEQKNGMKVTIEEEGGERNNRIFDKVLVAIGREPVSEDLGLENTKVQLDENGFVRVDQQRRTGDPAIFAIGDIAGEPMLAHKASHEGLVAAETIAGEKVAFEPYAIPAVVFTDPEVAWAGLTESRAEEEDIEYETARFPWAASGRATTLARADGLTKLLVDPESERILGVGITGPNAGELIAEGVLAIEMGATAADLALTIHPHPTLSETLMEAAEAFYGQSIHIYRPKRK